MPQMVKYVWEPERKPGGRNCTQWEFPGSSVVRTLCIHCWGLDSVPGWEMKILQAKQHSPKKETERKKAPSEGRGRRKKWASEQERAWMCHDSLLEKVSYEPENTRGSVCVHAKSLQLSPPLCDHTGYRPPGSSVRGISQTRTLEWVAMPSSRDLPNSGIEPASPVAPALLADSEPLGRPRWRFTCDY